MTESHFFDQKPAYEDSHRPRRQQVMLEPLHERISAILVDPTLGTVKNTMRGRLVRIGADCDPDLSEGLEVLFVPHGGTVMQVPKDHPERMVLPADQIIGIIEA